MLEHSLLTDHINIMHLNVYGGLDRKLEMPDFVNFLYNYEIILLSECWITEQTDIQLKGYECFKKVRP